jgi:hypothetical protein
MMFLLGRHATFGHAPPTYFRSIEAVRLPSLAIVQAINLPAVPLPSTRTSYLSGSLMLFISLLSSTTWDKKLFAAINLSDGGAEVWSFCRELAKAKSI